MKRVALAGSALAVVAAGLVAFRAVSRSRQPEIHDLGRDIRTYLTLPGDQVVGVPAGTYHAGKLTKTLVSAPHPATNGPTKGWLVLVAASRQDVIVDLKDGALQLGAGTSRIALVGFVFVNGTVVLRGVEEITFWYTDHSFRIEVWRADFERAGGDDAALSTLPNFNPTTLKVQSDPAGGPSRLVRVLGSDFHDVGDDGIFLRGADDAHLEGLRLWNVDQGMPNVHVRDRDRPDLIHNDSVQTPGAVHGFELRDSYVGQRIQWGAQIGDVTDAVFERLWIANSRGFGMVVDTWPGRINQGRVNDVRTWGNGTGANPYDPNFDRFRIDIEDGKSAIWPLAVADGRAELTARRVREQKPPFGVRVKGGRMIDENQALEHASNPANQWRRRHPYDTWSEFLGVSY